MPPNDTLVNFLTKHGRKLHELRVDKLLGVNLFELCPALNIFTFSMGTPVNLVFSPSACLYSWRWTV
jgi:hypothetical protein